MEASTVNVQGQKTWLRVCDACTKTGFNFLISVVLEAL